MYLFYVYRTWEKHKISIPRGRKDPRKSNPNSSWWCLSTELQERAAVRLLCEWGPFQRLLRRLRVLSWAHFREISRLQDALAFLWTSLGTRELFGACTNQAFKEAHWKRAPQVGTVEKQMVKNVFGVSWTWTPWKLCFNLGFYGYFGHPQRIKNCGGSYAGRGETRVLKHFRYKGRWLQINCRPWNGKAYCRFGLCRDPRVNNPSHIALALCYLNCNLWWDLELCVFNKQTIK